MRANQAKFRIVLFMIIALMSALFSVAVHSGKTWANESSGKEEPFTPVVGYSSSTFTHVVKENAQTAAKLWSNLIIRKKNGIAETKILNSRTEMEKELGAGKIDLLVLLSNEYLELKNRSLLEPLFVSVRDKESYDSFILLVRKDSGIRTIEDLRGKKIALQKGTPREIHRMWFELLVLKQGAEKPESYFSLQKEVLSPSQALMPVFFKEVDACILSRQSFEVMAELNPQLLKELQIIEETIPLATGIIAVRKGYDSRQKAKLREILETLDQDAEGRQLLTLFRMSGLVPFRGNYLIPMKNFLQEYNTLKSRKEKRKP